MVPAVAEVKDTRGRDEHIDAILRNKTSDFGLYM
jgi:hypothetical protein